LSKRSSLSREPAAGARRRSSKINIRDAAAADRIETRFERALNLLLTLTILYLVTPSALATARFEYARPLQELTI
jgi:hypothetical protein